MICAHCQVGDLSPENPVCPVCGHAIGMHNDGGQDDGGLESVARRELADELTVERVVARDTRSIVGVGRARSTGRRVALRAIARDRLRAAGSEERVRAAMASASLDHPHLLPLYRTGAAASLLWYSMKIVEGRSLARMLATEGTLELDLCLRIVEQVASALHYVHRRGMAHGDVRPANVLLDANGWALLTDCAVGRALEAVPLDESPLGRARSAYRAPEEGDRATPAGDQYALAVTVFQCLTGSPPPANGRDTMVRRVIPQPPDLAEARPDVPPALADAVRRAMSPTPEQRYATVLEFVGALTPGYRPGPLLPADAGRRAAGPLDRRLLFVDHPRGNGRRIGIVTTSAALFIGGLSLAKHVQEDSRWVPPATEEAPREPATTRDGAAITQISLPAPESLPDPRLSEARPDSTPSLPVTEPAPERRAEATAPRASEPARTPPTTPPPVRHVSTSESRASGSGEASLTPGRLSINAYPWGQVFVDGRPIGNTPLVDVSIAPGAHRITVYRRGFRPIVREITVAPGEEFKLYNIRLEATGS